jgi:hypothetical protein
VNSTYREDGFVNPIAATMNPAIMQTRPSITMNHPNADSPGIENPNGFDRRNIVLPYNINAKPTIALSDFIPATSSS